MKKFILYCLSFAFTLCAYFLLESIYILKKGNFLEDIAGREIYISIEKSKEKTKYKKLVIGDSTANQLFMNNENHDSINSLACNQAIGLCGHFFLLNNYLQAGNRPEEVYLIYNVFSFTNNLDQVYTYHYFIKPFYKTEYKYLMTANVICQIKKQPFYYISQIPNVLISNWAPKYKAKSDNKKYTLLSPISREYLSKMDSLSNQYNFRLYYIPSIIDEIRKDSVLNKNKNEYKNEEFAEKFSIYMNNISYLNDSCFMDSTHFYNPYLYKKQILEIIRLIKEDYKMKGIY